MTLTSNERLPCYLPIFFSLQNVIAWHFVISQTNHVHVLFKSVTNQKATYLLTTNDADYDEVITISR